MSSVHCVVVWEWRCSGGVDGEWWLPHGPAVARQLERAYAKRLTRVVLADADPTLSGLHVDLLTLTQTADILSDKGVREWRVRRSCYSVQSPAGRGARWEWARLPQSTARNEICRTSDLHWEVLPMDVQCQLEETWQGGSECCESIRVDEWAAQPARMLARSPSGAVRLLRRLIQQPYPLTRSLVIAQPALAQPSHTFHQTMRSANTPQQGRCVRVPHQHTGSSVRSACSASAAQPRTSTSAANNNSGRRSASPRLHPPERKPGLARQILHNLNIFSIHSNKTNQQADVRLERPKPICIDIEQKAETDSSSTRSARRHSVDTVSTYLSHESKESLQQPPVGELLDCSIGSDDVFETLQPIRSHTPRLSGKITGIDASSDALSSWVVGVECVQWGAVCPQCLRPLDSPNVEPVVALRHCQHMLHLKCLNAQLNRIRKDQGILYIECGVCGRVYGGAGGVRCGSRDEGPVCGGDQPTGSMAWCVQPHPLPGHSQETGTILITYNFASGSQGSEHPAPGEPYYAVGFPRQTVLPDTPLGQQVLGALRVAWERRRLFTVGASLTTGREYVVCWAKGLGSPLPGDKLHYSALTAQAAELMLTRALISLAEISRPTRPLPSDGAYQELT